MQKTRLLFLLFAFSTTLATAQCDAFDGLIQKGNQAFGQKDPNYLKALNAYSAALLACPF
jgi:hypothetical protein